MMDAIVIAPYARSFPFDILVLPPCSFCFMLPFSLIKKANKISTEKDINSLDVIISKMRGLGSCSHAQLEYLDEMEKIRAEMFEMITKSEMQCHHPADDGSDECGEIDDCMYHSLLQCLEVPQ